MTTPQSYSPTTPRRTYRGRRGVPFAATVLLACAVSTQQEVTMGGDFASQINRQLRLVQDAEVVRYINVLGDSLAAVADDRGLHWNFYVVDSKEVNAFAAPGGYIWVNRGLIERTTSLPQLAGVLAHEIGHVTLRHTVQQMQTGQRANIGLTLACILTNVCDYGITNTAVQVGGGALFAKFSRDDETEADRAAVQYVTRAGITPEGIPEMFEILLKERESQAAGTQGWFSTHPLEEQRVRDSRAEIAKLPAASRGNLRTDSERFQQFRRRVMALPAAVPR
jgi:predicted Zn-dependent protease